MWYKYVLYIYAVFVVCINYDVCLNLCLFIEEREIFKLKSEIHVPTHTA